MVAAAARKERLAPKAAWSSLVLLVVGLAVLLVGLGALFLLVLIRVLLRRPWLALPVSLAAYSLLMFVVARYRLLALFALLLAVSLSSNFPVTPDLRPGTPESAGLDGRWLPRSQSTDSRFRWSRCGDGPQDLLVQNRVPEPPYRKPGHGVPNATGGSGSYRLATGRTRAGWTSAEAAEPRSDRIVKNSP